MSQTNHQTKAELSIKGTHIFSFCKSENSAAKELEEKCENVRKKREELFKNGIPDGTILRNLWEEYRHYVELLEKKFKTQEIIIENITTNDGRTVLAQRLGGDQTFSGIINFTALGSDNTAPALGNTQLGNEVFRKALSSGTNSNNICYLETFFTANEAVGQHEEMGMFIDGNAAANSGKLFNRFISSINKSNIETLNVQSIITFSNA